ncbi:MAG: family 1 glycosylhydrolase [Terrimicrobiaceae bacterium]|nr:family 1 glycosylhydrolase [Terrimicrobiaceae bacterium]
MSGQFLWGVSTSGYQSEGGFNGDGQPQNNWSAAERGGHAQRTGGAAEFWTRYAGDFARARAMGCNAFRLGIEWPRVQPSTSTGELAAPPPFDFAALDAYADRIAACRAAGLEPVVTLQHFTHPAWLGLDAWLADRTVDAFDAYVRTAVERINSRLVATHAAAPIRYYVTLNEPNILVQNTYLLPGFPGKRRGPQAGIAALNRLLAAHVRAYNAIHDLHAARGWGAPLVTTNTFCSDTYWSERAIYDLLSLRERGWRPEQRLEPIFAAGAEAFGRALRGARLPFRGGPFVWLGRLFHRLIDRIGRRAFTTESFAFLLRELAASPRARVFDYLGLDYYDPFAGHMFRPPSFRDLEFPTRSLHAWLMAGLTSKWWDWRLLPEGMHFFCGYYAREYARPVLIAENGMALRRRINNTGVGHRRDRRTRSEFLRVHLAEVARLRREGCPLLGYMHWSLTDNYEWGSFTPRFGLFTLDYAHGADRLVEDQLGDRPSETYAQLIAEAERTR